MSPVTRQTSITFPARKNGVRLPEALKAYKSSKISTQEDKCNVTPKTKKDFKSVTPSSALATLSISSPTVNHAQEFECHLPCREEEAQTLHEFLMTCVVGKTPGSVYISGQPGTGKTATLSHLISLNEISDNCQIVMANCTSVKTANSIYTQIASSLNLKLRSKTERHVVAAIEETFTRTSQSQKMILLILDEIDQLSSKFQTVLYKIFEWPAKADSRVILVGIANAVDLTDRALPRLRSLVLQPKLMHFKPYTKEQIVKILRFKLSKTEDDVVFAPGSLELISAKVAGQSGDIRRAIDLGRRVMEISRSSYEKKPIPQRGLFTSGEVSPIGSANNTPHKDTGVCNSSRKRAFNPSDDREADCSTPRKTPRKTIITKPMQVEKENLSVAKSPRERASNVLERTPCKPLSCLSENSPVLRKTPRRSLMFSDSNLDKKPSPRKSLFQSETDGIRGASTEDSGPRRSPRKSLFQQNEPIQIAVGKGATSGEFSPRRSPRKLSIGRTPTKCSPTKATAINATDVLSVMNEICPSARRLRTEQSAFPLHQKLLICTLMLVITKGKSRDVNIGKLYEVYGRVCSRRGITAVDLSEFISVCRQVEMAGALQLGKGPGKLAKVTLQWDETEVTQALKDTSLLTAILSDTQVLSLNRKAR